jgi:hypothetical protein
MFKIIHIPGGISRSFRIRGDLNTNPHKEIHARSLPSSAVDNYISYDLSVKTEILSDEWEKNPEINSFCQDIIYKVSDLETLPSLRNCFFLRKLLHQLFRIRSNGPQIPGG